MNFEKAKKDLINLENPTPSFLVSSICGVVPYFGNLINEIAHVAINKFQREKREQLLEIILKDKEKITSDMVNNVEFIMNFAKTLEAVNRLSTNDKITYFANLIKNGYFVLEQISNDEFEEYLDALNKLSFREIGYLIFLHHEEKKLQEKRKRLNKIPIYYESLNKEFKKIYNKDARPIYEKLKSSGFVGETLEVDANIEGDEDIGYELSSADIDSYFYTTSLFADFIKIIEG